MPRSAALLPLALLCAACGAPGLHRPAPMPVVTESSPATDTARVGLPPVPAVTAAPLGQAPRSHDEAWDRDKVREWRVRPEDGEVFTIFQSGPRLEPGTAVRLVRAAGELHFVAG